MPGRVDPLVIDAKVTFEVRQTVSKNFRSRSSWSLNDFCQPGRLPSRSVSSGRVQALHVDHKGLRPVLMIAKVTAAWRMVPPCP